MAKLKARGRDEIFRVSRTRPGSTEGVREIVDYRALMDDGNLLTRMVLRYDPSEAAKTGRSSHDYGWKVRGHIKGGLGLEEILKPYLDKGWKLENASPNYFRTIGDSIEAIQSGPLISLEASERRKQKLSTSRERAATKRAEKAALCDGPGFYVTNNYTGSVMRTRIADHERPFATLDEALEFAMSRYARFTREFNFRYLLPVVLIEAASRDDAIENVGHVWWSNGKNMGPPVDPNQTAFNF